MKQYFLITSSGAAATTWLGSTLHRHPQIVCSNGTGGLDISMVYEQVGSPADTDKIASFILGNNITPGAEGRTLDQMFDELESVRPVAFYGNVHAETVFTFADKISRTPLRRTLRVANLVRHPVARTHTKFNIIRNDCERSPVMNKVCGLQFKDRIARMPAFVDGVIDQIGEFAEHPVRSHFINALMDSLLGLADFNTPGISDRITHFKIEEVKSNPASFEALFKKITGGELELSPEYLRFALSPENANAYRYSTGAAATIKPKSAEEQWHAWEDWQRRAFHVAMDVMGLHKPYQALGYDFSFVGSIPSPQFPGLGKNLRAASGNTSGTTAAPAAFNQMPSSSVSPASQAAHQVEIGQRYLADGDWDIAEIAFRKALELDSKCDAARNALTQLSQKRSDSKPSHSAAPSPAATPARTLEPAAVTRASEGTPLEIAAQFRNQGNAPLALEAYESGIRKAREQLADNALELLNGVELASKSGKLAHAFEWLRLATRWSDAPKVCESASQIFRALLANPKMTTEEALQLVSHWFQQDLNDPRAWLLAAAALDRCGAPVRALQARIQASSLQLEPDSQRAPWIQQVEAAAAKNHGLPPVVCFDALHPDAADFHKVLRNLFTTECGYDALGGPELSKWLPGVLPGAVPFYHSTQSNPQLFSDWIQELNTRVILIERDPRDTLVQLADAVCAEDKSGRFSRPEVMRTLMDRNWIRRLEDFNAWNQLGKDRVIAVRAGDLEHGSRAVLSKMLEFVGLQLSPERLDEWAASLVVSEKTDFIRRSDLASDGNRPSDGWRSVFDRKLAQSFAEKCGSFLIALGYEKDQSWVQTVPERIADKVAVGA